MLAYCSVALHSRPPQSSKDGTPKPDFDFGICIGGDGTLLHYSSLYSTESEPIPPVMTLGLGTLGFMTIGE